jgi:hypothetical protein
MQMGGDLRSLKWVLWLFLTERNVLASTRHSTLRLPGPLQWAYRLGAWGYGQFADGSSSSKHEMLPRLICTARRLRGET